MIFGSPIITVSVYLFRKLSVLSAGLSMGLSEKPTTRASITSHTLLSSRKVPLVVYTFIFSFAVLIFLILGRLILTLFQVALGVKSRLSKNTGSSVSLHRSPSGSPGIDLSGSGGTGLSEIVSRLRDKD